MEIIVTPIFELVKLISSPIAQCWRDHRGLKENWKQLVEIFEDLDCKKRAIDSRLVTEHDIRTTILNQEVENWLKKVVTVNGDIEMLKQKVETVRFFSRASLGKKIIRNIDKVKELRQKGTNLPNDLVIPLPQQTGQILPIRTLVGETTSKKKREEIWACLMGDEDGKIGVCGMGGIGKTTVMKDINNHLLDNKDKFAHVIWVTVSRLSTSKAFTVYQLQEKIASEINLDISKHDDETKRASMLYQDLIKRGSYVLILDDLWDVYHLEDVGIPEPSSNGSKLVLTTRLLNVCWRMNCKVIHMEPLSVAEASTLFLHVVGRDILSRVPTLREIVDLIVQECGCLPLAIVVVAASLKGAVHCYTWQVALQDLKTSNLRAYTRGTDDGIFEKLKFSYDRLNDENLQNCLLYCALYPEDYEIEKQSLIEYLIDEGIVNQGRSRKEKFERGMDMLRKLVNACLLEDGRRDGRECVKMHDLIRDMALQITRDNGRPYLVEAGRLDEENWKEDLEKVSLINNNISIISSSFEPKCPRVSTLLLCRNLHLTTISNNFFIHLKGLNLLDLSGTSIEILPDSISDLVSLTTLLLSCEKLKYVPSLAKLTNLKKLDFSASGIEQLPQGMEKLVNLRCLNLDRCEIDLIPDGILCKLSNLRDLELNRSRGTKIRGEELIPLRKLEDLSCALYDVDSLNAYVRSLEGQEEPTYYILQLGCTEYVFWIVRAHNWGKTIYLTNCDISVSVAINGDCPILLPEEVEALGIERCHINVTSLCELSSFENATKLKCLCIDNCKGIEHLFSSSLSTIHLLQRLEKLRLEEMWDLRGLIRREKGSPSMPVPSGTFSSLKVLRIYRCDNVERLFITGPLPNLEDLQVSECKQLVEIFSTHHAINAPKLGNLFLSTLPELQSIPVVSDSSNLILIAISKCPKLKKIPPIDRETCPPSLFVSIGEDLFDSLEWDYPNTKDVINDGPPDDQLSEESESECDN